jgi:outer membrane protein TolC
MTNWNPYAALLEIKSRSIVVDIAKLAHKQKLITGASNIAKLFYSIDQLQKKINTQKQIAAFKNNTYQYGVSKNERGAIDPVQVRMWRNDALAAKLAIKELESQLNQQTLRLKQLIGYHPDYYLPLDTRNAESQILGGFRGQGVNFARIQAMNHDLKLLAKKEQLQSNAVAAAYMALVPQPSLVMENLVGQQDRASGFNLALGLNYYIWDGFRRVREVRRQKIKARQLEIDRKRLSEGLYGEYRGLLDTIDISKSRSSFIREQVNLAELAEERALSRYKSGDLSYEQYIQARIEKVSALSQAHSDRGKKVEALLDLATMAGGLNRYNARIRF